MGVGEGGWGAGGEGVNTHKPLTDCSLHVHDFYLLLLRDHPPLKRVPPDQKLSALQRYCSSHVTQLQTLVTPANFLVSCYTSETSDTSIIQSMSRVNVALYDNTSNKSNTSKKCPVQCVIKPVKSKVPTTMCDNTSKNQRIHCNV